ncbi:MAG: hypothetical protein QXW47_02940 [Candidatus Jordarchaeales archaeon]|nr:hypothetical protein [Candidatus Jordarchaeia archaeon]
MVLYYTPLDYFALAVAVAVVVVILALYAFAMLHLTRTREEVDLYAVTTLSFLTWYAIWGVAEWYLIMGYWHLLGLSPAYTIDIGYWSIAWSISPLPFIVMATLYAYYFTEGFKESVKDALDTHKDSLVDLITQLKIITAPKTLRLLRNVILSAVAGMAMGNIAQDRICGALCCWINPSLWPFYVSFLGDAAGALLKWVIPAVIIAAASWFIILKR